jgi:hypothetical protein
MVQPYEARQPSGYGNRMEKAPDPGGGLAFVLAGRQVNVKMERTP